MASAAYGVYPPNVGTVCTVNGDRTCLFTTGFMPELGTYPGPAFLEGQSGNTTPTDRSASRISQDTAPALSASTAKYRPHLCTTVS